MRTLAVLAGLGVGGRTGAGGGYCRWQQGGGPASERESESRQLLAHARLQQQEAVSGKATSCVGAKSL